MSSSSSNTDFLQEWRYVLAPHNLGYKVKLLSQLMYRDFLERLEPHGLTPFHYLVLSCLWEEDSLSTSGILFLWLMFFSVGEKTLPKIKNEEVFLSFIAGSQSST